MLLFDDLDTQPEPPAGHQPLAWQLAPESLQDFIGQTHLLGPTKPLRSMLESDSLNSMILWGPPGCGKTAFSRLIASHTHAVYESLNAVMAKIADLRDIIKKAKSRQPNQRTILFIDEIHRFSKTQQDALLPDVERGTLILIGATTENPFFSVISALTSRAQIFEFNSLTDSDLELVLDRAIAKVKAPARIAVTEGARTQLIAYANGDARKLIGLVELAIDVHQTNTLTAEMITSITQSKGIAHNLDTHYDLISAYIKSMRGSDANAALYWLARLLKGGKDPRFIARRLMIFASEDVGLADPQALPLATSAMQAAQTIGMPEVQLIFSHVTSYLANAPKSNATAQAIGKAMHWIDSGHVYAVPTALRDSHYSGAKRLGHGDGYLNPHVTDEKMMYLPETVRFLEDDELSDSV